MNESIEFKSGAKVRYVDDPEQRLHSKVTSVGGDIKEVDQTGFGDTVTVVYDELGVGYHYHFATFNAKSTTVSG